MSLSKCFFFAALVILAANLYLGDELPSSGAIRPELAAEPLQTPTKVNPFDTTVEDISYRITPLYHYDLYGLIVSKHESDSFIDWVHKAWGDKLNVADVCVVWGKNATSGVYQDMSFSSGNFTCYYRTQDQHTWEKFSPDQLSNNHLIVDQRALSKQLKKARVGDQIHFSGYLAEYSNLLNGAKRGSSITRTDQGNGACETVYLTQFEVIKRAPVFRRYLGIVAILLLVASIVRWYTAPLKN